MARQQIMEFFESIGQDAKLVCIDDITNQGYYTFVTDAHGNRLHYADYMALREHHEWPHGDKDWRKFIEASQA